MKIKTGKRHIKAKIQKGLGRNESGGDIVCFEIFILIISIPGY